MEEIFMLKRMLTFKGVPKHGWAIRQHSLNEERSDQRAPQRAEKGECNFVCAHHGQLLRPRGSSRKCCNPDKSIDWHRSGRSTGRGWSEMIMISKWCFPRRPQSRAASRIHSKGVPLRPKDKHREWHLSPGGASDRSRTCDPRALVGRFLHPTISHICQGAKIGG